MKKILFASDIDNTLIYSYKKKENGYICVEKNKGREQGFMTAKTFELFPEIFKKVTFIPVTTRAIEQYMRIRWGDGIIPEYALVANGAVLLHNNEIDLNWNVISHSQAFDNVLLKIYNSYANDKRFINCKIVDGSYVMVYCSNDVAAEEIKNELEENCPWKVEFSGKKIYFFPHELCKGNAIKKFYQSGNFDMIFAAGDSSMDISLLNAADVAIVPNRYQYIDKISAQQIRRCGNQKFSEYVLETIGKLIK